MISEVFNVKPALKCYNVNHFYIDQQLSTHGLQPTGIVKLGRKPSNLMSIFLVKTVLLVITRERILL